MEKIKKTFGENLEQFELAKLKEKYEKLGYNFKVNYRITRNKKVFIFDAYAKHPKTKEEIIFEVKSKESIKKGDTELILNQRADYLSFYPNARFVLVLAREVKTPEIANSDLNKLFLNYINAKYIGLLSEKVIGLKRLESVQDISFQKIEFSDFKEIKLKGFANLKFWIESRDLENRGEALSDGIPFNFNAILNYSQNFDRVFDININTKLSFDFSEFEL